MRWCPLPGCEDAVELPIDDPQQYESTNVGQLNKSRDVCCNNGHFFCWLVEQLDVVLSCNWYCRGCGDQPHEPCSCDHWKQWHEKIKQSVPNLSTGNLLTVILEYFTVYKQLPVTINHCISSFHVLC